jgi:Flp pilus assembly protein TadG
MKREISQDRKQESGQIIVLLAISLLVLIIVSALAVDGGMIYSERRFAQNAADASSLAGGGAILNYMETKLEDENKNEYYQVTGKDFTNCTDELIKEAITKSVDAAQKLAQNSNFIPALPYLGLKVYNSNGTWTSTANGSNDLNANHGIVIYCNPIDKYIDTQVKITSQVSTAFAHLIFSDELVTTNIAISRARPRVNIGFGNGIVSLSDTCQNNTDGMEFTGTGIVNVIGGGIHSNSCLIGRGNVNVYGDAGITLSDSAVTTIGGAEFKPDPDPDAIPLEVEIPDEPTCSSAGSIIGDTYQPGNYPSGIKITNGTWNFKSGTYCLQDDLEITGGKVRGYGVTFFMKEGNVRITGNADVRLTATYDTSDPMAGMLIYMAVDNPGLITLVGTDTSLFTGTVFAPTGNIEAGGTSDGLGLDEDGCNVYDVCKSATFSVQLIGWYVKVVGTSVLDVYYNDSLNHYVVGKMHLLQ